ncbi:MAG: anti-anti-sigma factor [Rhodospirillaceae bacterium]|nr:MAG: anti-anti-sigma factor [Rhodospirillaceae bacterium]
MDVKTSEQSGIKIVAVSGEVDLSTSPQVRDALLDCILGGSSVVVDLSQVAYIDSSGVASLVEAFQNAKSRGQGFALANVGETPLRVLQLARLDQVFVIHDAVDDAVSSMS